ncbi:MAG: Cys-tRNA(Pro) deacylase [Chloroflexi bacterium]|nr:Cys-tRNA(Pro) deacylase [Chloroflexota bacterium]
MKKTQAGRLLEARGIDHRVTNYDAGGEFHTGEEAAALVGAAADLVYKTLVLVRDGSPAGRAMLVMIPVADQLDLKAVAAAGGEKRVRMATQREAERLTDLRVGSISALALTGRSFEVLIDDRAQSLGRIHVSAGARGMDVELAVDDLVALTGARYVKLKDAYE